MTTKNVPLNVIAENLSKVLKDKAQSAQYYSDNEQYICLCGWCGPMSPISRPAYVKTFGKATTEAAEVAARELIANKEAARQRTKYAEHAKEADRLEGIPAVGGFFWADNSGLKCDGGRGLFEELHNLTYYTKAGEQPARLCCVERIINVTEEDFQRPELADELVARYTLRGFSRSEDVSDDASTGTYNEEDWATFYTVGALVVSPSGKYFLIDSEGYDYARYIYLPIVWPVLFADELAAVKAAEEARKAEEERQEAEAKAARLAEYRERCARWSHLMRNVEELEKDGKTTARKIDNARKANILAMCTAAFPGVKFSVSVRRGWGADFEVTWTDGPTEEEFSEKTDLDLFCSRRDTFNGWDDSTDVFYSEFVDFARKTMGNNAGDIAIKRKMSDEARNEILAEVLSVVPAANVKNEYGQNGYYSYSLQEVDALADALGVNMRPLFFHSSTATADSIARHVWTLRSYTPTTAPASPTLDERTDTAAAVQDAAQDDEAPAEGLALVDIADGRKNGKTFSILGVRYNAPASLRENVRDWLAHNAPTADRDAIPADADFMSVNAALSVSHAAPLPVWCSSLDYLTRILIYYGAAVCAAPASAGRHLSVPKKIVMVGMMQESARR